MLSDYELSLKQTEEMMEYYADSWKPLYWSKFKLQEVRNERLRKLLKYVQKHSPWYQKCLAGMNFDFFSENQLHEIPPMDKKTLMNHWDEIVTDRRLSLELVEQHIEKMKNDGDTLYLLDAYHALASSGSSGTRGIFVYGWEEWIEFYLYTVRYHVRLAARQNPARQWKSAVIVISNSVYAMYSFAKTFKNNRLDERYIPVTLPTQQIVDELNTLQPDFLVGTPTTISRLCHEPHVRRLRIQPTWIIVSGEPLFPLLRQLINKTWPKAYITNLYASSEGVVALNCWAHEKTHEMHLNDDGCILQPVDKQGNKIEKGLVPHKMYLTNLYLHTLPLIRYEYGDQLVFLNETCQCGVNHQLFREPVGRPEYNFMYPGDIFVHHLTFVTHLLLEKNIQEYQVVQTERGVIIRIIPAGSIDLHQLTATIRANLSALGLVDPEVTFVEVNQFEYTPAGKLFRFLRLPSTTLPLS